MRVDLTASWIFRGWITYFLVALCAQTNPENPDCNQFQYLHGRKCCSKCKPGQYALELCTNKSDTKCLPCPSNEYQSEWNREERCHTQKYCDGGRGFKPRNKTEIRTAPVPCECLSGFQCSENLNCEYCVKMPPCSPGQGFSEGAGCVNCSNGFFSNVSSPTEPCRPWTDCKALGKTEDQPGNAKKDVICGTVIPPVPGNSALWGLVAGLSVIIVISMVILFLVCYKLKPLSDNFRSCVLNLKRSRKQQETSSSFKHGIQDCSRSENTYLIQNDEKIPNCGNTCLNEMTALAQPDEDSQLTGNHSEQSASEPSLPTTSSSCSCVLSLKEPMEVGENEDCSQVVATGISRNCSCGNDSVTWEVKAFQGDCLYSSLCCESAVASQGCANNNRHNEPCCCSVDSLNGPVQSSLSDNFECISLDDCNEQNPHAESNQQAPDSQFPKYCSDPPLASGNVTGSNNTTFISNGQVMNFSGEVIVVYVSRDSQSSPGVAESFSSPVQEESNGDTPMEDHKPKEDSVVQENMAHPLQEETQQRKAGALRNSGIPVQEESNEWTPHKCV
ncbi:tumor necrosis factor receptor superfamily member 11A isoform X2 [Amia ocellicauda]|uniref:tumor necrosis factor receptor superfamily member 11A isoform X2 n=1 Tax=Amia ocellicauda TaxID=2972642 RepID=UPI003463E0A8